MIGLTPCLGVGCSPNENWDAPQSFSPPSTSKNRMIYWNMLGSLRAQSEEIDYSYNSSHPSVLFLPKEIHGRSVSIKVHVPKTQQIERPSNSRGCFLVSAQDGLLLCYAGQGCAIRTRLSKQSFWKESVAGQSDFWGDKHASDTKVV